MARSTRNLPGDTAECGVLDGASSYLICSARQDAAPAEHHAFDSFEGLSVPRPEDRPVAFEWAPGDLSVPLEEAMRKAEPLRHHPLLQGLDPEPIRGGLGTPLLLRPC